MTTKARFAFFLAAIFLIGAIRSTAQTTPSSGITGLAHVALRVSDLDKEVNFFGKLGFEEAFGNEDNGRTLQVFIKINDLQFLEIYPQADATQPLGLLHACYESADLNALNARYTAAGLNPAPVRKAGAGNLLFTLQDPDGRVTEFIQYMPGSRHMNDKGQHLGERRVSDQLLGFELPVANLDTAKKFYETLGFDVEQDDANLRLSIPANPGLRIDLHAGSAGDQPQLLFPVDNARRITEELRHAGVDARRDKKLVFVHDPDGNTFVLLETGDGQHSPRHILPWKK